MKVTNKEYDQMTKKASPPSTKLKNETLAFVIGGLICTFGQLLFNLYTMAGLDEMPAKTAVSVTLIGITAILTACHVYDNFAKFAGAGSLVPITGFANAVVSPAIEFKSEGQVMGIGAKMFIVAGPVIVFGLFSSAIYGIILCILALF
jgi:stage V sporulation protein AC